MAKSSFFSGTGTTPTNVESVASSKAAAEASETAAAASAAAAAQSATQAGTSNAAADTAKVAAQAAQTAAETAETNAAASAASVGTSETNAAASATAAAASETAAAASATAAGSSQVSATQSSNVASTKATEASTSATNAATSATNASASETAAAASETAAAASETAAAASETAASASETAAAASETAAATSETNAASSATSASTSATTATTQATNAATSATQAASSATSAATSETNASASETAAAASETAAATSETNAANSATASATSATNSATSATASANSATAAAGSASAASTSATDAATSASDAATSETNAASSATSANSSQVSATQSASVATTQATNAATSATAASNSATAAAASETAAASSESAAATSETNAATSASNASSSASAASGSATTASTQATNASNSATAAATSATNSANSATASANSASAASTSATAAASSASSAQASKDAALAALDSFDDRYLGQKANDPSTDNDGNALVSGSLYFNTTSDIMKVYDGSAWVAAYASLSGTLTAANNLSDLDNASDARTNLGLAIGTNVQAYSAILTGTTASYTTAEETKLAGIETGATADQTAAEIRSLVESATDSNVFTDADHTKLNGIESGATADQTASEILTAIKTVDGAGSGLDADTLDGSHASAFLTGNQTITLTGDATGSGTTSISVSLSADSVGASEISANAVGASELNVTGNGTTSQFLRSDGDGTFTWATPTDTNTVPNNATITLTAGTGLSGGGNFTTDQSTNETITFNLSAPYTYIDTATGQYGTVKVDDDRGVTWAGYAIRDDWVFMSNGAAEAGIYNDTDNDWAIKFAQNGTTSLQYNGSTRFQTESAGASAPAGLRVGNSGNPHNADALEINTATDEHIVLSGSTNPYIRWQEGTTDKAYIQWNATQNALSFRNQETDYFDFYPDSSTGAIALRLKGTDGDQWGVVYATDSQEIGFLDEGGSWAYRIANDSLHEWRITNGIEMSLNTSELNLSGNNINNVTNMYVANAIYHYGDTNTYLAFGTDIITLATGGSSEITVNTTGVRLGDSGNGYFQPVSGNYGSVQIDGGAHGGYEGYSIGGRAVFMHDNGTATGIFNDVNNHWLFYGQHSSYTRMYFNGSHKVETTSTGVTVTGDLNSTSDIRYKKNIETIDSALEKVQSLRGVTFDWDNDAFKEDDSTKKPNFTERATGVIAQDVEKVLPEAVRENEDGFKNVAYGNMVGLLIEAIKEQQEQINALKAQLNS